MNTAVEKNEAEPEWPIVITSERPLLELGLQELWRYRDLIYLLVRRDVVTLYKQTILGPIWFFIQPIMTTLVYLVVFDRIAGISTDGLPPAVFYLSGVVIWNYFAESFSKTCNTFAGNVGLFGKVYFPRLAVPIAVVIGGLLRFAIQFSLLAVLYAYYAAGGQVLGLNWYAAAIPFCVMLMGGLGLASGLLFSAVTTKYRDLVFVVGFGVQLLMYATPVIYPLSTVPEGMRAYLWWNPLAQVVELFRFGLLGAGSPSLEGIAYAAAVTLMMLLLGFLVFRRTEASFIDTV